MRVIFAPTTEEQRDAARIRIVKLRDMMVGVQNLYEGLNNNSGRCANCHLRHYENFVDHITVKKLDCLDQQMKTLIRHLRESHGLDQMLNPVYPSAEEDYADALPGRDNPAGHLPYSLE